MKNVGKLAGDRFKFAELTEVNAKGIGYNLKKEFKDLRLDQWNGARIRIQTYR